MIEFWDDITHKMRDLPGQLHPLLIIAGEYDSVKTQVAQRLAKEGLGVYFNLSLELARCLLKSEDTANLSVSYVLACLRHAESSRPFVLDHIELAFSLKIQVIPFFQELARQHPLVVIWPGEVYGGLFRYSVPNQDDYSYFLDKTIASVNLSRKNGGKI